MTTSLVLVEPLEPGEVPEGRLGARFTGPITALDTVAKYLKSAGWTVTASELRFLAKNFIEVSDAQRKEVMDFLTALDDHDDVHRVYAAIR